MARVHFFGSVLVLATCSSIFIPPLYANQLAEWLQFTPAQLQLWISVLDCSAFFALPASLLIHRVGTQQAYAAAAFFAFAGYGLLALAGMGGPAPIASAFVAAVLIGQGSILCVVLTLDEASKSFAAKDKGKAVGLLMTAFALSGGVTTALFKLFFADQVSQMALFVVGVQQALVFFAASMSYSSGVSPLQYGGGLLTAEDVRMKCLVVVSVILTGLVVLLPFVASPALSSGVAIATTVPVGVALLVFAAWIATRANWRRRESSRRISSVEHSLDGHSPISAVFSFRRRQEEAERALDEATKLFYRGDEGGKPVSQSGGRRDVSTLEAVSQVRFWIAFYLFAVLVGGGFVLLNNLPALATLSTPAPEDNKVFVLVGTSLFTAGNVISRFALGYLSDALAAVVNRESLLGFSCCCFCLAMGLLLFNPVEGRSTTTLLAPAFLTGLSFGAPWTLIPAIENEWYGTKHFASIHSVMMLGAMVGVLVCNDALTALAVKLPAENGPAGLQDSSPSRAGQGAWVDPYATVWAIQMGLSGLGALLALAMRYQSVHADPPSEQSQEYTRSTVKSYGSRGPLQ